ncbi:MAG TPA: BlaI/MecI/CopY family transcriptional regulator [Vicinamibacterales bacterium]|jgi:predicted transcriptional regulator
MRKNGFLFWGFKPPRNLVRAGLGNLEQQVIEIVWRAGEVTVRDVSAHLDAAVAYTTVMTTLDRLFRKGLLARTKRSRAFVYSASATREELDEMVASDLVSGVLSGEWSAPLPFLSNLVEAVGDRDRALLDELERLVKVKRRRMRKREEP